MQQMLGLKGRLWATMDMNRIWLEYELMGYQHILSL
jgi:hypothetical protein